MVPVIFKGGGAAVVVVDTTTSGAVDSVIVTFFVVLQCVAAEVGADGAVVVEVDVGGVKVVMECRILSVVTVVVVSGLTCGVVLLVVKGATGVTDSVV